MLLSLDAELQENPIPDPEGLRIPKLARVVPPQGDTGALAETAKMLVAAENPVIICDRLARTPPAWRASSSSPRRCNARCSTCRAA